MHLWSEGGLLKGHALAPNEAGEEEGGERESERGQRCSATHGDQAQRECLLALGSPKCGTNTTMPFPLA